PDPAFGGGSCHSVGARSSRPRSRPGAPGSAHRQHVASAVGYQLDTGTIFSRRRVTAIPQPTQDLYRHVNGEWMEKNTIPADRGTYGAFMEQHDQAEVAAHHLPQDAAGQPADNE